MVEGARLESVYTATYRGFESLLLRQNLKRAQTGPFDFAGWRVDDPLVRQTLPTAEFDAKPLDGAPCRVRAEGGAARIYPSFSAKI